MSDPLALRVGEEFSISKSLLSMLTNFPGAAFWIINDYLGKKLDSLTKVVCQVYVNTLYLVIITMVVEGTRFDFTDRGILGILAPQNLFICFFWSGLWSGFFGYCGYIISTKYFSSLVIMNVLLVEPLVSQLLGVYLEIDEKPGILTFLGVVAIIGAINLIQKGSRLKREQ
mmetsp:Transcript_4783/g.8206  ORF Transcript_4783/g.8206 Transcript_4783/m.8206 type:complete len:171 (-) Transcript_4783:161-673(-)